jgi:hypothetical protein
VRRAPIIGPALAALAALALLAGCPLPQPLAEYPKGTVTPPRILMDDIVHRDTVILVPAGCTGTRPSYDLAASLVDNNTSEAVTARWFVDYERHSSFRCVEATAESVIAGPGDEAQSPTRRDVPAYHFVPYDHPVYLGAGGQEDAVGVVHVVELVVSNRFDTAVDTNSLCVEGATGPLPFRTPANSGGVQFETQTYRWVFVNSADATCP